jgi:hypothetical protein
MAYTLNQVLAKIKAMCLGHKQVRSFSYGLEQDQLTAKTTKYPAVFLVDNGGVISTSGQAATLSWKLFFMDLVNVADHTKENDADVASDVIQIAQDIIAQLNRSENGWVLSGDNNIQLLAEHDNDMLTGVIVDFSIRFPWAQNICAIPTTFNDYTTTGGGGSGSLGVDSRVYDLEYIATGAEGTTLTIPTIAGKKILFISRESGMLYPASNLPDTAEYIWNGAAITLGLATIAGERFLILYRNY